jgi:hypothetical protein
MSVYIVTSLFDLSFHRLLSWAIIFMGLNPEYKPGVSMSWALAGLPMSDVDEKFDGEASCRPGATICSPSECRLCDDFDIGSTRVAVQARLCLVVVAASYVVSSPFLVWCRCSMKSQLHFKISRICLYGGACGLYCLLDFRFCSSYQGLWREISQ